MSKAYKQAITNITGLTDTKAMQVCIAIAKSNPSVFNSACVIIEDSAMDVESNPLRDTSNETDKKIDAIKRVRNASGIGLNDASTMYGKVKSLLNGGKKIDAIKLVRNETGLDLSEAKEYVESL